MNLFDTKKLLTKAYKGGYAVPAINADNTDTITGVMKVCEKMKAPVIIQIAPIQVHPRQMNYRTVINAILDYARDYDVNLAVHLDHGDDLEDLKIATTSGFNSVMYDGSHHDFSVNMENTKKAREYADKISLEGELGIIGGAEGSTESAEVSDDFCTDVNQAKEYVKYTNVDFLAVAIGNAHGVYKNEPKLNFTRLAEINKQIDLPLVMHGASGLSEKDISRAVTMGISKINFFTDVDKAFLNGIKSSLAETPDAYTFKCFLDGRKAMEEKVAHIIRMCGCEGKA